ncbi:molybdate ABC transporter permease subunit [Fusibacter ferrireducens]|uniref:Molybdenum transport system permease n=1 Tax=Fusibacter ferrireducens TaxID=2785058 RepID=A0ABR9ZQA0_9FIRM|nr:molybdate ABC transporter permease subunit [Fusibacter ferrireducens]MBF4692642.1 molybdate ABC transporter permease subunit [Fusibacter ferrireducens]
MSFDFTPALISLKVTCVSTAITFVIGLLLSWCMWQYKGKFKALIDGIITLPLVLPPTVAGFIILLLIGKNGPIGNFLALFDVKIIFSWYAAVIASVVVSLPLMYKTSLSAFEQLDPNIADAARTLGVSEWTVFAKVSLPLAWPGIAAATALSFSRSLGEFGATLMVAGSIPGKTQTIPIAIYFATQSGNMKLAFVWVMIIFSISLVTLVSMNYWNQYQFTKKLGSRR